MKKNFSLIIAMLVLTVVIFIGYNLSQLDNQISQKQYDNLVNDLSRVTNNFGIWINNKVVMLNTSKDILMNFEKEDILRMRTKNPFLNINNVDPDVSQVYIGVKDGEFITGGEWIPPADYDPRNRVWYQEAIAADETIISKVYLDRETGDPIVTISSPLYIDEEFIGVISADVFLNNIRDYLDKQISSDNIYTFLLDDTGLIIIHTSRPEVVGQNLYTDIKHDTISAYFDEAKATQKTVRMEYVYQNDNIRGIMQKVEVGDWYLAVALESDDSFFDSISINKINLMVNGFGFLIMLILVNRILKIKKDLDDTNKDLINENEKDFLTNVYNRKYLNLYLENLWARDISNFEVSLMMIDLDNFKHFNDTYGHSLGDEVLRAVAKCISEHVRKGDVLARYGGEEFSLILVDVASDAATKVGNLIKNAVYNLNLEHKASPFKRVTISIGLVTVKPKSGIGVREAIDHADIALYQAKDIGRNSLVVYNDPS